MACWQITIDFMPVWPCTTLYDLFRRRNSRLYNLYFTFLCKWKLMVSSLDYNINVIRSLKFFLLKKKKKVLCSFLLPGMSSSSCPGEERSRGQWKGLSDIPARLLSEGSGHFPALPEKSKSGLWASNVLWQADCNQAQGLECKYAPTIVIWNSSSSCPSLRFCPIFWNVS